MEMIKFIDGIAKTGYENQVHREDDHVVDGINYCGVCGKAKETIVNLMGIERKVPCTCDCDRRDYERKKEEMENNEKRIMLEQIRDASLMDKRFESARFETLEVNEDNASQLRLCKRYVDVFQNMLKKNQSLIFTGDVGTGKSYTAACISNELMDKGYSVLMTSFTRILELTSHGRDMEEDIINKLTSVSLVIFDDLGTERKTDYALEKVYSIFDKRYRCGKPFIVTTNVSINEMFSESDIRLKRIYDRVLENGYPIEFKGKSWRKKAAFERFGEMRKIIGE